MLTRRATATYSRIDGDSGPSRAGPSVWVRVVFLALAGPFWSGAASAPAQTSRPATDPIARPATQGAGVRTVTGVVTTQAVGAGVEPAGGTRCDRFEALLGMIATPLDKGKACLAGARCVLVTRCAPLLANLCFGRRTANGALTRVAAEGLAWLDRASAALEQVGDDVDAGLVTELEDRVDLLRAFGEMFLALGEDPASDKFRKGLVAACNGLAAILDDENPEVVASAKLWMGVAYRLAGRPERTLQVVRPVVARPVNPRIGLLTRLERCLALGDRGDHVAALAICLRLGAGVESWFEDKDPATRGQAADAVRFTRVELLRGWAVALRKAGLDDRAEAADAAARELTGPDPYPPAPGVRLGLVESIVGVPEWEGVSEPTVTQPAIRRE